MKNEKPEKKKKKVSPEHLARMNVGKKLKQIKDRPY